MTCAYGHFLQFATSSHITQQGTTMACNDNNRSHLPKKTYLLTFACYLLFQSFHPTHVAQALDPRILTDATAGSPSRPSR